MKIKNDYKVILAAVDGLYDGVLNYTIDLPPYDRYMTLKESKAYREAWQISHRDDYLPICQKNGRGLRMLDYAILRKDITPIGWKIFTTMEGHMFIE